MSPRITVKLALNGVAPDQLEHRARLIALEQTVELAEDLVTDQSIRDQVVGRLESMDPDRSEISISYDVATTGGEVPQLLNLLFGNISLKKGILIREVQGLEHLLAGPRWGQAGIRAITGVKDGALTCTALKPMGLGPDELAQMAYELAVGGIDLIKDDHGLANQPYAPFRERVLAVNGAIRRANLDSGRNVLYVPNISSPLIRLMQDLSFCHEQGIRMVMICPFLLGCDAMAEVARQGQFAILAHPALSGSLFAQDHGMVPELVIGTLFRALGADASIYPNEGGRFSFERATCQAINGALAGQHPAFKPAFPVPAGGMTVDRVGEIHRAYGTDLIHLIGGGLLRRGSGLREAARAFCHAARPKETRL